LRILSSAFIQIISFLLTYLKIMLPRVLIDKAVAF
jgi:hypothetical protein